MAPHRMPGPVCQGSIPVRTRDGTMCRAETLPPVSIGLGRFPGLGIDLTVGLAWIKTVLLGPGIHWGVDSASAANSQVGRRLNQRHPRTTVFDHITALARRRPDFWGRYIGGRFALTATEARFLLDRGCRVLVIYNGAHDSARSVRGGYREGVADAQAAVTAATTLGVPAGTFIYADIEAGWRVSAEWVQGWSDRMYDSSYGGAGGVYADPLPQNAPNFNNPYCQAFSSDDKMRGRDGHRGSYVYSSEPEPGCGIPGPMRFHPATPPCNPNSVIWQYAEGCFAGLVDQDLANDVGFWSMWW